MSRIPAWSEVLECYQPLLLPAAHDPLTARLIRLASYPALQVGGFALEAARAAVPDIDLVQPGEMVPWVGEIIRAAEVPVLVDASNGGIDLKAVARTVRNFESVGASALFLEDQASPKRCGHMADKVIFPLDVAVRRLQVAADVRRRRTFLLARTDAYAAEGIDGVLRRGSAYLDRGNADGLYVEGVDDEKDLAKIGNEFMGRALALSLLEGGGKTPWLVPGRAMELGFSMILYPTSLLFRIVATIRHGLDDLMIGRQMADGVSMDEFLGMVDIGFWQAIEAREA